MGLFNTILEKLGFGKKDDAPAAAAPAPAPESAPVSAPAAPVAAAPVAISQVDVVSKLEALAAASTQKLNWKVSIVDLMKLLGLTAASTRARRWRPSSVARRTRWATRHR